MAKAMSEILEIHSLSDSGGDIRCYHGGKFDCWEASDEDTNAYAAFANHQADMIKAEGYPSQPVTLENTISLYEEMVKVSNAAWDHFWDFQKFGLLKEFQDSYANAANGLNKIANKLRQALEGDGIEINNKEEDND